MRHHATPAHAVWEPARFPGEPGYFLGRCPVWFTASSADVRAGTTTPLCFLFCSCLGLRASRPPLFLPDIGVSSVLVEEQQVTPPCALAARLVPDAVNPLNAPRTDPTAKPGPYPGGEAPANGTGNLLIAAAVVNVRSTGGEYAPVPGCRRVLNSLYLLGASSGASRSSRYRRKGEPRPLGPPPPASSLWAAAGSDDHVAARYSPRRRTSNLVWAPSA